MIKRLIIAVLTAGALVPAALKADVAANIKTLTGRHTRLVWAESNGTVSDRYCTQAKNKLMGIDSDDGKGIVAICATRDSYSRPFVCPKGDRVVYTNYITGKVHIINWDGTGQQALVNGQCTDVWMDTETGLEYIYVRPSLTTTSTSIIRYQIDNLSNATTVWDKTGIGHDNMGSWFTVSGDGLHAMDALPWPEGIFVDLPNGNATHLDQGCWPSMTQDISYVSWMLNTDHRTADVYNADGTHRGILDLHYAPGIKGWEIYSPRWSNHAGFVTMTGPVDDGSGGSCTSHDCGNHMTGSSRALNLYLGRLDSTRTAVTGWVQVTSTVDIPEFFGDAWIEPDTTPAAPTFVTPPVSRTVFEGGTVSFRVEAAGYPYPAYQWKKGGTDITGATFEYLTITGAEAADEGSYTVTLTSSAGTLMSDPVTLTVQSFAANSLVLHYDFENGQCTDQAGSNDGNPYKSEASTDAVLGSGSWSFGGEGYVSAGNPNMLNTMFPYSYSLWIKPDSLGGAVIGKSENLSFYWGRDLSLGADGSVTMTVGRIGGDHNIARSTGGQVTTGTWQHVVVTGASIDETAKIYVNGTEVSYGTHTAGTGRTEVDGESSLSFGAYRSDGGYYYRGLIDDVRVYNYTLSAAEVTTLYGMTGLPGAVPALPSLADVPNPVTGALLLEWQNVLQARGMDVRLYTADGRDVTNSMPEAGTCLYRADRDGKTYCGKIMVIK